MERTIALLDALMPRIRQSILIATVLSPDKAWYLRELARLIHVPPSSIQRELITLTEVGILTRRVDGNRTYYQADTTCPIFYELQRVLVKTAGVVDLLHKCLQPLAGKIALAFVFGSFADGTEVSASDIDLLIVGDLALLELSRVLKEPERLLRREINPVILSPAEAERKLKDRHHLVTSIAGRPKLFLMGQDHELARAFSQQNHQAAYHEPR